MMQLSKSTVFKIGFLSVFLIAGAVLLALDTNKRKSKTDDSLPPVPTEIVSDENKGFLNREEIREIVLRVLKEEAKLNNNPVEIVSTKRVEWSDSSLGCPKGEQFYTQMIVPGYKVIAEVKEKKYSIHINARSQRGILCDR